MMTRKDYKATAAILKDFRGMMFRDNHIELMEAFAKMMKADNPRFDENRFFEACGYKFAD